MIIDTQREAIARATQISPKLSAAIAEAIQAHADRYSQGKTDLEKVLGAIGEVASDFLADLLDPHVRDTIHRALFRGTAHAAMQKARQRAQHVTDHLQ